MLRCSAAAHATYSDHAEKDRVMRKPPLTDFSAETRRKLWTAFAVVTMSLLLAGIMLPTPANGTLRDTPFFGFWSGFVAAFAILAVLRVTRWMTTIRNSQ
jgi:hypothetical protein